MLKNIIREVNPEAADFSFYFDGDTFTEKAGGISMKSFTRRNAAKQ